MVDLAHDFKTLTSGVQHLNSNFKPLASKPISSRHRIRASTLSLLRTSRGLVPSAGPTIPSFFHNVDQPRSPAYPTRRPAAKSTWTRVPPRRQRAQPLDIACHPRHPRPTPIGARRILVLRSFEQPLVVDSFACERQWSHTAVSHLRDERPMHAIEARDPAQVQHVPAQEAIPNHSHRESYASPFARHPERNPGRKFALINPVMTSTDGRCVASIK